MILPGKHQSDRQSSSNSNFVKKENTSSSGLDPMGDVNHLSDTSSCIMQMPNRHSSQTSGDYEQPQFGLAYSDATIIKTVADMTKDSMRMASN